MKKYILNRTLSVELNDKDKNNASKTLSELLENTKNTVKVLTSSEFYNSTEQDGDEDRYGDWYTWDVPVLCCDITYEASIREIVDIILKEISELRKSKEPLIKGIKTINRQIEKGKLQNSTGQNKNIGHLEAKISTIDEQIKKCVSELCEQTNSEIVEYRVDNWHASKDKGVVYFDTLWENFASIDSCRTYRFQNIQFINQGKLERTISDYERIQWMQTNFIKFQDVVSNCAVNSPTFTLMTTNLRELIDDFIKKESNE